MATKPGELTYVAAVARMQGRSMVLQHGNYATSEPPRGQCP